jgi:hypothetical protein
MARCKNEMCQRKVEGRGQYCSEWCQESEFFAEDFEQDFAPIEVEYPQDIREIDQYAYSLFA